MENDTINQVLKYRYNKKNIFEVLELTINEAAQFFNNDNHNDEINSRLALLQEVGLGYLKLGQPFIYTFWW